MTDVAVVVPCFDLGRTLREAVDSVRAQTRPAGELLVIDDGSSDLQTRQALAELRREGVAVIRTANHGLAAVRNLGVRLTSAPYVVLLDADDLLAPTYLERMAGLLDERPEVDFVTCDLQTFGRASYRWSPPPCTVVEMLVHHGGLHASSMFRREVWESAGGFYEGLAGYEDFDFWLSAIEAGHRGEVIPEPLFHYRVRADSMFHRAIARSTFVEIMTAIYARHRASIDRHGPEILLARDAFIQSQRGYRDDLVRRRDVLERRLEEVEQQIAAARARLEQQGIEALDWGDFDQLQPFSPVWGLDRGKPLDRHYIEGYLAAHRDDIRGRVLEVKEPGYTRLFGDDRVSRSDVLDRDPSNPRATLTGELSDPAVVPTEAFDCFVFTQVLHFNLDVRGTLAHALRVLKPGGVLLCTLPAVSRLDYEEGGLDGKDSYRFSESAVRRLFAEHLPPEQVEVTVYGNVKAAAAFLYGIAPGEMKPAELDAVDPWFPLIYGVRAVKPLSRAGEDRAAKGERLRLQVLSPSPPPAGAVLMYHRVADLQPDRHRLCVPPADFRDQMRRLRERYRPMPLDELVRAAVEGDLPPGAVAVTLDDGCLDNLGAASPALLEFGIPATFFVTTDRFDERHEFPWDLLERILLAGARVPEELDLRDLAAWTRSCRTAEERAQVHDTLNDLLFPMSRSDREVILARIAAWSGLDLSPRESHRAMLADEIRELAGRPGHEIGAHTVSHLALSHQAREVQRREIVESKFALEHLIGKPVTSFAYPYGDFSKETLEVVAEAGLEVAVTVESRSVRAGARRLQIPRLEIVRMSGEDFVSRIDAALGNPALAERG